MKRLLLALSAAALSAAGCARHAAERPAAAPPRILRLSQLNEPDSLDPATASLPDDFFVIRALSEGLVAPSGSGFRPAAADRWSVSPDGRVWTFHLREGARWSDGGAVTAADFVASYRRVLTPATAAARPELFYPVRNARAYFKGEAKDFAEVGFAAPDPSTLVVTLERPTPRFLAYAASDPWIPVNPGAVARFGPAWTAPGHHVGNGPFVLTEWRPHQRIVARRNPLFHDAGRVGLDELQFVRFDDRNTEERAYRSGQVDVTLAVPLGKLDEYGQDRPAELHRAPLAETRFLAFNVRRPPFGDARVRRALSLALDRRALALEVMKAGQEPAGRLLPPGLDTGALEGDPAGVEGGPAEARRLLAEAGYPGGKGFPPLELSGWSPTPALEAIQAMWKRELGVEAAVVVREARVHQAALQAGRFDVGYITLIPTVADPLAALERFTTGDFQNYPHWSDARYDELVAAAAREADPGRQAGLLREAEERLLEEAPIAPVYFNAKAWLMRPAVRGWNENALWSRDYVGLTVADGAEPAPPAPVLRIGNGDDPQSLDPQLIAGEPEYQVVMALFTGLAEMDPKDLHPVPGLAESWDISADGLDYTFRLRAGLRWSDGEPLTADDFVQSYRRILTPALASPYAYMIYNFAAGAKEYYDGKLADFSRVGFAAPDARTLKVRLLHPTPYLLKIIAQNWAWDALPVRAIARHGALDARGTDWTRPGRLVGDGPYVLKSWVPQSKIVVERNPRYWDAASVRSDTIEFYPTQDLAAEERMFRNGQLDATYDLAPDKIAAYRRNHPEELQMSPWLALYYYMFNVKQPPLDDARVRRALTLAIDREAIANAVMKGAAHPAGNIIYPGVDGYAPAAEVRTDPAEARRLLAEAGYPGGKGFPSLELLYNTYQYHHEIAEAVQAMWKHTLGIDVRLRNEEWKVYEDATQHHRFQVARAGWTADYVDPQPFLEPFVTGAGNNYMDWSRPEFDRLFQRALGARDEAERLKCFQDMDRLLVEDCPVAPIYFYVRVRLASPKLKGVWPTLLDFHPWKYAYREP